MTLSVLRKKPYILLFFLLTTLILISANIFLQEIRSFLLLEAENSLKEVAQQCAVAMENRVNSRLDVLASLANLEQIDKASLANPANLTLLRKEVSRSDFIRIGLGDLSGNAITTDGQAFSIEDRAYFQLAKNGVPSLSDALQDRIGAHKNEAIVVYAVPIKDNAGQISGVMFASDLTAQLTALLRNIYTGPGKNVYILSREGDILISGANATETHVQNLFTLLDKHTQSRNLARIKTLLTGSEPGAAICQTVEQKILVGIAPIQGAQQWYIAVTAPQSIAMGQADKIMFRVGLLLLAVILLICASLPYFFHINKKYRREKENARHSDLQLQIKNTFIANVSHEIRTPINTITGMTYLLEKTGLSLPQQTHVNKIKTASKILLGIVNDILDISKITSGKLQLRIAPFRMSQIVADLDNFFADKIRQKDLAWEIHADGLTDRYIAGDAQRLTQVLINLINNAHKFTHQGKITLAIRQIEATDNALQYAFSVQDTGIGIEAKDLQKLFLPFEQLENALTKNHEGTGLGLSISQNLIAAMGGALTVHSQKGDGSTFSFSLAFPFTAPPSSEAAEDAAIIPLDTASRRVLLVEDNEINAEIAGFLLDELELAYDWAKNGEEAVARCREQTYDLILMDIHMPVLNGYAATKIIREKLRITAPILALTATSVEQDKTDAEHYFDDYILKPFQAEQLKKTLLRYLRQSER